MITNEEREEIAAKIAACITRPDSRGLIGGTAGTVEAPQAWYIDNEGTARAAIVVGFYADNVIFVTCGTGQVFRTRREEAFTDYEEALCEQAERQKRKLEEAQAAYLATCNTAARFLREQRDKRRAAKKRPADKPAE